MKTTLKKLATASLFLVFILQAVFVTFAQGYNEIPQRLPTVKAKLAGHDFRIMLARTNYQKAKGLMFYYYLPEDEGMLFVYRYSQQMSFWMKNTRIPLDLVFFSSDLKVTEWIENMTPGYGKNDTFLMHYKSVGYAKYALELKAGTVKKLGIKKGDELEIPKALLYSE